jgi:hypothetical protein
VNPRDGDAQKALRRTYITSALVCGRNPKLVAAELGHATSHMVVSNYDSFLDPRTWPDEKEVAKLRAIYGWDAREALAVAPHWHPSGVGATAPDDAASELRRDGGIWRAGIRTPDPQVRRSSSAQGVTRACVSSLCRTLHRHAQSRRIRGDGNRRHGEDV